MAPCPPWGKRSGRFLDLDFHVPERFEPREHTHHCGVDAHHGEQCPLDIANTLIQVHKPPALGVDHSPLLDKSCDLLTYSGIRCELLRMHFGITSTKVESLQAGRQVRVVYRAEENQLGSSLLQQFQVVRVVETERFVSGHSKPHSRTM